jgi:hypothetical protein
MNRAYLLDTSAIFAFTDNEEGRDIVKMARRAVSWSFYISCTAATGAQL